MPINVFVSCDQVDSQLRVVDEVSGVAVASSDLGGSATIYDVAFSPDHSMMAFVYLGGKGINVVNTGDWTRVAAASLTVGASATGCAFSPDGSKLAVAYTSNPGVAVFNTTDWTRVAAPALTLGGAGQGVAFSPDGALLAVSGSVFPRAYVFNTSDWSLVTTGVSSGESLTGCTFSPDGGRLIFMRNYTGAMSVRTDTWAALPAFVSGPVFGTMGRFSNNGSFFALGHSSGLHIYRTSDWGKVTAASISVSGECSNIAFSPDDSRLIVSHANSPWITEFLTSDWSKTGRSFGVSARMRPLAFGQAGARYIRASVRDIGSAPAARRARVLRRSDGVLQAKGISDAVTGDLELQVYSGDIEYDVQFMTEDGESLNDLIFARVASSET